MTSSGIAQVVERRGDAARLEVNPHRFRHTFSHVFLDRGGAEGDLMELNGWSSPQMLARYGRTARMRPAREAFLNRFEKEVDPDGTLPPEERGQRAEHAKRAYMLQLAKRSAAARKAR
jgi:hypothetical protein